MIIERWFHDNKYECFENIHFGNVKQDQKAKETLKCWKNFERCDKWWGHQENIGNMSSNAMKNDMGH
jgi:hypothetical protein